MAAAQALPLSSTVAYAARRGMAALARGASEPRKKQKRGRRAPPSSHLRRAVCVTLVAHTRHRWPWMASPEGERLPHSRQRRSNSVLSTYIHKEGRDYGRHALTSRGVIRSIGRLKGPKPVACCYENWGCYLWSSGLRPLPWSAYCGQTRPPNVSVGLESALDVG